MKYTSATGSGRYALAIGSVLLAITIRLSLTPFVGPELFPFTILLAGVVFSAWYCGLGPSIVAAVISLCGAWYAFLDPRLSLPEKNLRDQISGLIVFAVVSGFIIALGEANRRAREHLEQRVRERTAELSVANEQLRTLTAQVLKLRDDERRRLARELHDSVGQLLAAISMNIGVLQSADLPPEAMAALSENAGLVKEVSREIRTMSHLLHPPLLDELGLLPALKWYVEGFSNRSHIAVNFNAPDDLGRLDSDVETAIFRVIQECLTNIHRHSGSASAMIAVSRDERKLQIIVQDKGKGIPAEKLDGSGHLGIGLTGMRQRMVQLGGNLEVSSDGDGTTVRAILPMTITQPTAPAGSPTLVA